DRCAAIERAAPKAGLVGEQQRTAALVDALGLLLEALGEAEGVHGARQQAGERHVADRPHELAARGEARERDLHQPILRVQVAERVRALGDVTRADTGIAKGVALVGDRTMRAGQAGHRALLSRARARSTSAMLEPWRMAPGGCGLRD